MGTILQSENALHFIVDFSKDPSIKPFDFLNILGVESVEISRLCPSDLGLTGWGVNVQAPFMVLIQFNVSMTLNVIEQLAPMLDRLKFYQNITAK